MMKAWATISFTLVGLLMALHIQALLRHSSAPDPNGYEMMVVFFYGVPLAILASIVSTIALIKTKRKLFWLPLTVGLLPIIGWPTVFVLEFLRVIP